MKISFPSAIFMTIGAMIGSAIFSLSGLTIVNAGSWSLLSWLAAAVILLGYGLIAASLAKRLPESGGMFNFPIMALSPNARTSTKRTLGFISAWVYFFGCFAGVVFSAQYIGMYVTYLIPNLANWGWGVPILISIASCLLALAVNLQNIKLSAHINAVLTVLLIVTLLIYIVSIFASPAFDISRILSGFDGFGSGNFIAGITSTPIAMVAYGSIVAPAFIAGRIAKRRNKQGHIASIQIIAIVVVVILYISAIFATLGVLTQSDFQNNPNAIYSPFVAAISQSGLPATAGTVIGIIVTVGAILALFTTQVVVLALGATSIETSAVNGALPQTVATRKNSLIVAAIACCVLASFPDLSTFVINMGALFNALFIAIICITAASLTLRDSNSHKVIVAVPVLILIALITCYAADIVNQGIDIWLMSLSYLLIGAALFVLRR